MAIQALPGQFAHRMSFFNDGSDPIFLTNMSFMPSVEELVDFNDLPFPDPIQIPDVNLVPGMSTDDLDIVPLLDAPPEVSPMDIVTEGDFLGNYIYHTYTIERFPGDPNAIVFTARHLVVPEVEPQPALSQWGLIIMALLIVTAGAIMIIRRRQLPAT
jgi:hypothetical protein